MRCIRKGDTQIFGLTAGITAGQMGVAEQARGRVAERLVRKVLVAVRRFTDGEVSAPALFAFAANDGEGYDNPVSYLKRFCCHGPDLYDLTHGLMAHDIAGFHAGHEMVVEMQVGAADRATGDLDDGVPRVLDLRVGYPITADVRCAVPNKCLHPDLRSSDPSEFTCLNISGTRSFQDIRHQSHAS
jgi:hypothetical protein